MLSARLPFLAFFVVAAAATAAHADQAICQSDADCAVGEFCALTDCGPACDPDEVACEPTDCGTGGVCFSGPPPEPTECVADSDCADGDVCVVTTFETCSGGGSDPGPGGNGDAPPPPEQQPDDCVVETFAYCAPPWEADCTIDADCGTGFSCAFLDVSNCACTAPDGDDSTDECVCDDSPATSGTCILDQVECSTDVDCENDFVCILADTPTSGSQDDGSDDARPAPPSEPGFCAPVGFEGPREDEPGTGNAPPVADAEVDDDGEEDDTSWGDIFGCSSTAPGPAAGLPFLALGLTLGLRRRRR